MSNRYTFKPSGSKPSSSNQGHGFDAQFSDLTMSGSGPPNNKKQRVQPPHKPLTPKKSGLSKAPLKFDFKSTKSEGSAAPRYISKPVLPSQLGAAPAVEDDWGADGDEALLMAATQAEANWGQDGEDDLLAAASQMVEIEDPFNQGLAPEELNAMTMLLDDDDWAVDEDMENGFNVGVMPKEEERLHQTMTIFESEKNKPKQEFKPPPIPKSSKAETELLKLKNEHESLKAKHLKGQGETTMLRDVLNKKERELNLEKIERRKLEDDLNKKVQEQINKSETQLSSMKTEKLFLQQELESLKEKLRNVERNASSSQRPPLREQGQVKQEQKPFVNSNDFFATRNNTKVSSTQTDQKIDATRFPRKCLLKPSRQPHRLKAETFCKISTIDDRSKTNILQALSEKETEKEIKTVMKFQLLTLVDTTDGRLNDESISAILKNCVYLVESCRDLLSETDHKSIIETCSKLLTSILRMEEFNHLESILSLLFSSWSCRLSDDPDLTAYILSTLSQIVHRGKPASSKCRVTLTPQLISLVLKLVGIITRDSEQSKLLCKQNLDDCFLFTVSYLLHHGLNDSSEEILHETIHSLVRWVLSCLTTSHHLPFLGDCSFCTGDIVRILTNATYHQVLAVLQNSGPSPKTLLSECLSGMVGVQDIFSARGSLREWGELLGQKVSVQRRYIWTIHQINTLNLAEHRLAEILVGDGAKMECS